MAGINKQELGSIRLAEKLDWKGLMDKSNRIITERCVCGALSVCLSLAATTHQEMETAASYFGGSF
jgi:hypothetical protein